MERYDHKKIEQKRQVAWEEAGLHRYLDDSPKPKFYALVEFPYPSGDGLHTGHVRSYTALDAIVRKRRREGYNVLYPIGWDAFGLPTENFAIKTKMPPAVVTKKNTDNFRRQLKSLGLSFDWEREINTTDPAYYKWTQWIFLQMFKKGLAYKKKTLINWCVDCKIGLANEEVMDGACERCGGRTEKREKEQWMLAITKYADRLHDDLDTVDYLPKIQIQQRNWIGRSEGALIDFPLAAPAYSQVVFASNNKGKLARMQKLFKAGGLAIELKTPRDIGIENFDVDEDGKTLADNAEKKARALAALTDLPVFADDSGFFIDGAEIDPVTVKRNALEGTDERSLSVEEIGRRMHDYYQNISRARGGKVDAEWRNALCFISPQKEVRHIETVRPVILTDESRGTMDPYMPLRPLYVSKATNKHVLEQDDDEELLELEPLTEGLKKLFSSAIRVFTTRADTLFGATYMVLAPDHELVEALKGSIGNWDEVSLYAAEARKKTEMERTAEGRVKTGVRLEGVMVVNPANKEEIPVFIADYVLKDYGTGAIMAVPAHDERDFEFAKKFGLPIREVVAGGDISKESHVGEGVLINSGQFDGLGSGAAKEKITSNVGGKKTVTYKLRDWVFSRQRYWGEPIPLVHCEKDGWVSVSEAELPVVLPDVEAYTPTDTGESPLATMESWVRTTCPSCGGPARRETDTMPQWAGSSWYYLRYLDPENDETLADKKKLERGLPVDWYNGGMEHTTLHLLYSRFWHKFLYDIGAVSTAEPYRKRTSHGMVLAEGGEKMSKSKGNVVNPDSIVESMGADTLRIYELFMGPFDQAVAWSTDGIVGPRRFLERIWKLQERVADIPVDAELEPMFHHAVKKVSEDIEGMRFNTAVSELMVYANVLSAREAVPRGAYAALLSLLAPFAPHIADELWERIGEKGSVHAVPWPKHDVAKLTAETRVIAIQVNGKVRAELPVSTEAKEADIVAQALALPALAPWLAGKSVAKTIYVPGRLLSIVAN